MLAALKHRKLTHRDRQYIVSVGIIATVIMPVVAPEFSAHSMALTVVVNLIWIWD